MDSQPKALSAGKDGLVVVACIKEVSLSHLFVVFTLQNFIKNMRERKICFNANNEMR